MPVNHEGMECIDCSVLLTSENIARFKTPGEYSTRRICRFCFRIRSAGYKRKKRSTDSEFYARELERNKTYREKYSDGYRAHRLKKREKHKSQYYSDLSFRCTQLVSSARRRAKKKGLAFDIDAKTLEAVIIVQGFKCSLTGTPFDLSQSADYIRSPSAPSLDRKDNRKGYTWDNLQVVAAWYNIFKNEWSDQDARKFIELAYKTMFARG